MSVRIEIPRSLADTRDGREEIIARVQAAFENLDCDGIDILDAPAPPSGCFACGRASCDDDCYD